MNKRITYLDLAKGILIITVVLSHSPFKFAPYMYWFHMPAFFIISGILHKQNIDFKIQLLNFYIPYIIFSVIDIMFDFIISPNSISLYNFILYFSRHIYSGKAAWGVFWFIPILFLTRFVFTKMQRYLKTIYIILFIFLGYLLAHVYSINTIPDTITLIDEKYWFFLGIDVLPICLSYYAIGFYSKNILKYLSSVYSLVICSLSAIILLYLNIEKDFYYYLNIKESFFKHPILDLIYPLTFTILILSFSNNMKNKTIIKFLSYCGKNSLIIMYLHKPVGNLLLSIFPSTSWVGFTLVSLSVSLLFNFLVDKYKLLSILFKGSLPNKASANEYFSLSN